MPFDGQWGGRALVPMVTIRRLSWRKMPFILPMFDFLADFPRRVEIEFHRDGGQAWTVEHSAVCPSESSPSFTRVFHLLGSLIDLHQ
jgi:hypothetical protein